jgi:hypothetical protein
MRSSFACLVVLLVAFAFTSSTFAVDRNNPLPVAPKPTRMAPAPLSSGECTQLGGTVSQENYGLCNSGKYCATRDQNGKAHKVCISKQ